MSPSDTSSYWIGRIIGAVIIAPLAYVALIYYDTWELSGEIRLAIAGGTGLLFLILGGSIWRWIDGLIDWPWD